MKVEVFGADEQSEESVDVARWVRLAQAVLESESKGMAGNTAELSMLFVDEVSMTDLHRRYMGMEGPTDVLAFPLDEAGAERGRSPDSGGSGPGSEPGEGDEPPLLLGDVVVCPLVARRNAAMRSRNLEDELALLVVHGILHLLGMDHTSDDEATAMQQRERELLARFYTP